MKTKILLPIFACITLIFSSGFSYHTVLDSAWSEWQESSCYKGIQFRTRLTTNEYTNKTKDTYDLEIKNNYQEKINISWTLAADTDPNKSTTDRIDIKPNGETFVSYYNSVPRGCNMIVIFNKVRFGEDGLQPYYNCDK